MNNINVFTVSPMSYNIELAPGQEYINEIVVANPANATQDFNYKIEVSPYAVMGEGYDANFLAETGQTQITEWITIQNPVGVLKPNETARVSFTIKVPETASPGGQYAALLVSSDPGLNNSGDVMVNSVFEMASVIYAKVDGEVVHEGKIVDNIIPGFVTTTPIQVGATLTNSGNVHEIAEVGLEVKSLTSSTIIYPQPGDSGIISEIIMPGTSRYLTRDIVDISPLGIYEVTQTINYLGDNSKIKQTVMVCPVWFMSLLAVTIIILIVSIVYKIKVYRKRRRVL